MSVHIELTDEQYKELLEIVYLGRFICDMVEDEEREEGNEYSDYEDLEQYLLSFAGEANLSEEYISYSEVSGNYVHTARFEDEGNVFKIIDDYMDSTFWEELTLRLAKRDFTLQYGEKSVQNMSLEEKFEKEQPFFDRYSEEFFKHGIRNLQILKG